ncbi:MAG TPA: polyprenyl synthetase family protein [Candidatus Limnocylindrales bacterium]|nr:polyprenyl synthetase family protein [Candidatus Limnocylindrales bacterium]
MREASPVGVDPGLGGAAIASGGTGFLEPIRGELDTFERRLHETVHADLGPVADAMEHILDAGGKRLRPALVLLSARLGDPIIDHAYGAAMAIEFIHNATLIHDDLIDRAPTRRGLRTIHESLGPNPAIIIGDYYFAKGANLMSQIGEPRIDLVLSQTVMAICYGEMLQLTSQRKYDQSVQEYHDKIERKTAALLAASTFVGAVLGRLAEAEVEAMRRFGHLLGMAFQIADDVLDYRSSESEVGKPVGNDLKQGTVTLPLMLALHDETVRPRLERVLARVPMEDADYAEVVAIVRESRAIEESYEQARSFSRRAAAELDRFAPSPYREALRELTAYVVRRKN